MSISSSLTTRSRPRILFFDSGVGGLSVLQTVESIYFDNFEYLYFFDNELFPYSEKPDKLLQQKLVPLLTKVVVDYHIDYLVVACNTASTLILDQLRQAIAIPVIGVVPAIKPAVEYLVKHHQTNKTVGLLATKATVARPYTLKLIDQFSSPINKNVSMLGTTELVEYAEAHIKQQPYTGSSLQSIFAPWLNSQELDLGVIVLACTHFSLIKDDIKKLFPNVMLIDACFAIARRIGCLAGLIAPAPIEQERQNFLKYLEQVQCQPQLSQNMHKQLLTTKSIPVEQEPAYRALGFDQFIVYPHIVS